MEEIIDLVNRIIKINQIEYKSITREINIVITNNIKDINIIEKLFDRLLNLLFIDPNIIKETYYVLLDYYRNINEEYAIEYEKILIEQTNQDNIKLIKKKESDI